jgi:hypothetical protein
MWGFIAKAGAWAWAHKAELSAAWGVYKRLRNRRKEEQGSEESAVDYYKRTGWTNVAEEGVSYATMAVTTDADNERYDMVEGLD